MKFLTMVPDVSLQAYSVLPYVKKSDATDADSKRWNQYVYALKDGGRIGPKLQPAASAFAEAVESVMQPWFTGALLLPLPGSEVSPADRSTEKTVRFAQALAGRFPGCAVSDALVRVVAVPKSHQVVAALRPPVGDHVASLTYRGVAPTQAQIVLVDDVLTRGTTAIAAEQVLRAAGFAGTVRLVSGAHTRFAEDTPVQDVEWLIEWSRGALHPTKRMIASHTPPAPPPA